MASSGIAAVGARCLWLLNVPSFLCYLLLHEYIEGERSHVPSNLNLLYSQRT